MTSANAKLAADLNLDLQSIASSPPSDYGTASRRVATVRRLRQSYEAILLAFNRWCDSNGRSFSVEIREFCLARMGLPITLPPAKCTPENPAHLSSPHLRGRKAVAMIRDRDGRRFPSLAAAAAAAGCSTNNLRHHATKGTPFKGTTWSFASPDQKEKAA